MYGDKLKANLDKVPAGKDDVTLHYTQERN